MQRHAPPKRTARTFAAPEVQVAPAAGCVQDEQIIMVPSVTFEVGRLAKVEVLSGVPEPGKFDAERASVIDPWPPFPQAVALQTTVASASSTLVIGARNVPGVPGAVPGAPPCPPGSTTAVLAYSCSEPQFHSI